MSYIDDNTDDTDTDTDTDTQSGGLAKKPPGIAK